jgi:hypothetical protein
MKRWRMLAAPLLLLGLVIGLSAWADVPAQQTILPAKGAAQSLGQTIPNVEAPQGLTTLYLPLVVRDYDPGYIVPFGHTTYEDVSDELGLSAMQTAGSRWATTVFYWAAIEPNPPVDDQHTYNWAPFDALASRAQAAGVDLFVLFTGNPSWAAQYPGGPVTNTAHLVNFVTAMAERYDGDGHNDAPGSPVINNWSFYPEPDSNSITHAVKGKGLWGDNPNGYAAMLAQVSPAMRAANPNARVMMGGLAYDYFTTEGGPFVREFLGNVLARLNSHHGGATTHLAAVAFHYYPIGTHRWATIREKAGELRGIMTAHGAGSLPLLVPEMGYWSDPAAGSSETLQAQNLVKMYVQGLSAGIPQLSWFSVFDHGPGTETHGLFRNGDLAQPKPAYTAYSVMASELTFFRYLHEFLAPGVEGYVFSTAGGQRKTVLWATSAAATADFAQTCLRRVDLMGGELIIQDGGSGDVDGVANGNIRLTVSPNHPIYVGSCP